MLGMMYILAFGVYLLISVVVVTWAIWYAHKHGKSTKIWGLSAALLMYLLVFWDWIPTILMHKYYCATEAGFKAYKTVEQWKTENPGELQMFNKNSVTPSKRKGDDTNFTITFLLNKRITKVVQERRVSSILHIYLQKQELLDTQNNQVLASYVNFRSGYPNGLAGIAPRNAKLAAGKFWIINKNCNDDTHPQHRFYEYEDSLIGR